MDEFYGVEGKFKRLIESYLTDKIPKSDTE